MKRISISLIVLTVCVSAALLAGSAGASAARPRLLIATPQGVGPYKLGASLRSLHKRHLLKRLRPGCELDPGQRVARLRGAGAFGFAIFGGGGNRLTSIQITNGARTKTGIRIGSSIARSRAAYPKAEFHAPGTFDPFSAGFLFVGGARHTRLALVFDAHTRRVASIDVPSPSFCE